MLQAFVRQVRYPLGRWHNCGAYYDPKFLRIKEEQKKKRLEMKQKFEEETKKKDVDDDDEYMRPFITDS